MRRPIALFLLLALPAFIPTAAQTRIGIQAGITGTSSLLRDSIAQPLSVRPGFAPTLGFRFETGLNHPYRLSAGLSTSWSNLSQHSADSASTITTLVVWTPTLTLSRAIRGPVAARASIGALIYDPDDATANLFREGSPVRPLIGAGISAIRDAGNGIFLTLDLGYDTHRFTTQALLDAGFRGEQLVHRVTATVTVSRALRP